MSESNTTGTMAREERYFVAKLSKINYQYPHIESGVEWQTKLVGEQAVVRGGLVIESDWPEYEPAWQMIEDRDCGKAPSVGSGPAVHRYQVIKMLSEEGGKIDYRPHGPWVVMADAHDAVVAKLEAEINRLKRAAARQVMA